MQRERIWLSRPHMGGQEQRYVQRAFDDGWVAPLGRNVDEFEVALAKYCGVPAAAAVNTGTAAIHLALQLLGVQRGDTVFVQSLTFAASAFPVLYQGAKPVFIDSEPETWNMSPVALERALRESAAAGCLPRAVVVVDLYGQPADYDAIRGVVAPYGVPIVEDAAEALGSTYHQTRCGGLGDYGCLSFNGNKIITTSGGGALLGAEDEMQRARYLSTQAKARPDYYWHTEVGHNFRMSNVSAGIGLGQMLVLDDRVARRRAIAERYAEGLADLNGVTMKPAVPGSESNCWLSVVKCDAAGSQADIGAIIQRLESVNIEARALWCPMNRQPVFGDAPFFSHGDGSAVCDDLFEHCLCLPSGSDMTDEQQDEVIAALRDALDEVLG